MKAQPAYSCHVGAPGPDALRRTLASSSPCAALSTVPRARAMPVCFWFACPRRRLAETAQN